MKRNIVYDCLAKQLVHFTKQIDFKSADKDKVRCEIRKFYVNRNDCDEAVIVFLVDAVLLALSLVGLKVENEERLTRALIRELGPETLNAFSRMIEDFNEADSAYKKSQELFKILKLLKDDKVFDDVKDILKDEMSFKAWLETGVIAFGQLLLWFGSDGVAFVAECVLVIMSATDLIEDGYNVNKNCKKD
jgi:hypothetical protein